VLAFADVMDFLADEFAGLGRGGFALALVGTGAFKGLLVVVGHDAGLLLQGCGISGNTRCKEGAQEGRQLLAEGSLGCKSSTEFYLENCAPGREIMGE